MVQEENTHWLLGVGNHQRPHHMISSPYLSHNTILSWYCDMLGIAKSYIAIFSLFRTADHFPKVKLCQDKYLELTEECWRHGWKARCEPVEVGCRGFAGQSLHQSLSLLEVRGLQERRGTKNLIDAAEKASRWLWIKRGDPWCSALHGHKLGADHPRLGRPGEGVWWSKTWNTRWPWVHHWRCV